MAPRHTQGCVGGRHIWQGHISRAQQTKSWCAVVLPTPCLRRHPPNFIPFPISGWRPKFPLSKILNKTRGRASKGLQRPPTATKALRAVAKASETLRAETTIRTSAHSDPCDHRDKVCKVSTSDGKGKGHVAVKMHNTKEKPPAACKASR